MFDTQLEKLVDELESQIATCQDIDRLNKLADKYGKINHPQIGYRLGEKYLLLNAKEEGISHLLNSICFGLDPQSAYLRTGYADSIGQSMWYLIKYYAFKSEFETHKYKLYCSAYFCLSRCIAGMGVNAYDSLRTRALMIDSFDKNVVKKMLVNYYYDKDDLCTQILSMSDYFLASKGFLNAGKNQNSANCLNRAKENMDYLMTLAQYTKMKAFDITMIAQMSKQNQDHLVKNLASDFKAGLFQMTPHDLRQAVINYRR